MNKKKKVNAKRQLNMKNCIKIFVYPVLAIIHKSVKEQDCICFIHKKEEMPVFKDFSCWRQN